MLHDACCCLGRRLFLAVALILGLSNASFAQGGFVYGLVNVGGGSNQLYGFSVNASTGALTLLPGFPIAVGTGVAIVRPVEQLHYDSVNSRLYVLADGSDTLSAFSVDRTSGALTALPFSPIALGTGSWDCVTGSPNGSIVVTAEAATSKVASYVVTASSATAAPGSPFNSTTIAAGFSCEFSADGTTVYVGGEKSDPNPAVNANSIASFSVNPTNGALTMVAGSPFATGANFPLGYASDATGRLFEANFSDARIRVFTSSSGVLTPVSGNPFSSGLSEVIFGLLNPAGLYMVADRLNNQVGVYTISGSGSTTTVAPASGSPFATGSNLTSVLAQNASGTLLFAGNGNSRNITVFRVNPGSSPVMTLLVTQPANTLGTSGVVSGLAFVSPGEVPIASVLPGNVNFGAVNSGGTLTLKTPTQGVLLIFGGPGTVTWTVSANQPWITVSPTSGTGPATINISVNNPGGVLPASGLLSGAVTITTSGAANSPVIPVNITTILPGGNTAPAGSFDTPGDGTTGVTGSLPVTGWGIDDIGVSAVRICRDAVAGEGVPPLQPLCGNQPKIFIGNASFVFGARPDIAGFFPTKPFEQRAGWGYLMLTNFLPAEGNGTFRILAFAEDFDGFSTFLGAKTITCTNATATVPFGSIDTPEQGGTANGSNYANFGWVLAAQRSGVHSVIPTDGSTISVFIDSMSIGTLNQYNLARSDIQMLFPGYVNTDGAVGVKFLNTTTLQNGVHTIAWVASDTAGAAAGIGSRYFTVVNSFGGGLQAGLRAATEDGPALVDARPPVAGATSSLTAIEPNMRAVTVRHGFDDRAFADLAAPDADGVRHVSVAQLERVVVDLDPAREGGATYRGYLIDGETLRALPIGSHLDAERGEFAWAPGLAFGGTHSLVFVREANGHADKMRVDVAIDAHARSAGEPRMVIDTPDSSHAVGHQFTVAGWAIDPSGPANGAGIDTLHVWAYPTGGGAPVWVGVAAHGGERPDVAAAYGGRFAKSGFSVEVAGLAPGTYDVVVYAHSVASNRFTTARSVRVKVE